MQTVLKSGGTRVSRFLSRQYQNLNPYVPGEQPQDGRYIKLNTNENPFPPSLKAIEAVEEQSGKLYLYSDPECKVFLKPFARYLGVEDDMVFAGNGSDEVLSIIFQSFCEEYVAFADITYGFYNVYARINNLNCRKIPLREGFVLNPKDYYNLGCTIVIANPNAPTGMAISKEDVRGILEHNLNNLVVIDEAYVEFGAESALELLADYDNLLIVGTFSKSRSLAGARLGYAISNSEIIKDINRIKFSINPYNVNRMTLAAAAAALEDEEYFTKCKERIIRNREYTLNQLSRIGFSYTNSLANFIFVSHKKLQGKEIYQKLKERGILVRWFDIDSIKDYVRITIGKLDDMQKLIDTLEEILMEET